jgi:hypothetical protein
VTFPIGFYGASFLLVAVLVMFGLKVWWDERKRA